MDPQGVELDLQVLQRQQVVAVIQRPAHKKNQSVIESLLRQKHSLTMFYAVDFFLEMKAFDDQS
jgi:hypothetical protein